MSEDVDVFLEHYGVAGMHWGVRKSEDTASKQRSKKGMSWQDKERLMKIGLIAVGAVLVVGGALAFSEANTRIKADLIRRLQIKHVITWKKDMRLTKAMSMSDLEKYVIKPINPNYGTPGTTINCMRSTMAYEMRRRGFNVRSTVTTSLHRGQEQTALSKALILKTSPEDFVTSTKTTPFNKLLDHNPTKQKEIVDIFKKTNPFGDEPIDFGGHMNQSHDDRAKTIFNAISKHPPKARGELSVGSMISGHSVAWENINGKPVIIDAQSGVTYRSPKELAMLLRLGGFDRAGITRLDDKPMNKKFLERWLTDA